MNNVLNSQYKLIIYCAIVFSQLFITFQTQADTLKQFEMGLQGAYRVDELEWNIAGNLNGTNPNILSELSWTDLKVYQLNLNGQILSGNRDFPALMKLRWNVGVGLIMDGENQDSDYLGNNRTLEFSRSNNNADDGSMYDASIGLGPHFANESERLSLSVLVGFSYHGQNLRMTDGYQTIDTVPPVNLGSFPDLHSTYETKWWGPWVGIDISVLPLRNFKVIATGEFHLTEFEADADWNLRTDFQHPISFEHWGTGDYYGISDGYGVVGGLAFISKISRHMNISLEGQYKKWKIHEGVDRIYFSDGTISDTRLNEVNWDSWSATIGISYLFR